MARAVPNFVRKTVARWRNLTSRPSSTDWEEKVKLEADEGWDSSSNSEWELSIDEESEAGWDSHSAGEVDSLSETDSGYCSVSSTSPKSTRNESPSTPSADEVRYRELPYRTKHYFLTYIQRILEATCLRYARENLAELLTNPEWKKTNLLFKSTEYLDDRLVNRDWLAEDEIELESWMQMFARIRMPHNRHIFEGVIDLRNEAVHRGESGDREKFIFEDLTNAMKLPTLLADSKAESEITNAFKYIMDDPTLDKTTKASVESAMYTPQPCTSHYQVLSRLQTMLEESCFNNARRNIPETLIQNDWSMPEQVELPKWHSVFRQAGIQNNNNNSANGHFSDINSHPLLDLLGGARIHIRIVAAHRLPLTDEKLAAQVQRAIAICVLLGDWRQAIEIEVLAEGYFTQRSRKRVVKRLEQEYRKGWTGSRYERQRRLAICGFLGGFKVMTRPEGRELLVSDEYSNGMFGIGDSWTQRTWSPSMHECLKRVEVL